MPLNVVKMLDLFEQKPLKPNKNKKPTFKC